MLEGQAQFAGDYCVHLLLGEGGQANVYLGSRNGQLFALKVYLPGANREAAFRMEVKFLQQLRFAHLINMVEYHEAVKVQVAKKGEQIRPMIVLEYAVGGELFEYVSKMGGFSQEMCRTYMHQLVSAIKYMADIGVAHRDLKPENLLFDGDFILRVSDFGLAREAKGALGNYRLQTRVGTEGYKPPEMEAGDYNGCQADMFAAGVVLFVMYSGGPPFLSTRSHDRIYKMIREKNFIKFWQLHEKNKPAGFYSSQFKRLINSFFSVEPDRRPTFDSLLDDEWMNGTQLSKEELIAEMQKKAKELISNEPSKQQIMRIMELLQASKSKSLCGSVAQSENCDSDDTMRCDQESDREENDNLSSDQLFLKNYKKLEICIDNLPEYTKDKVVYTNLEPAFLIAWLQKTIAELFSSGEVFLENFAEPIVPVNYEGRYWKDKKQIAVTMLFEVNGVDETQLRLSGQLHKADNGRVGVDWRKLEGHSLWLASIQAKLSSSLLTFSK